MEKMFGHNIAEGRKWIMGARKTWQQVYATNFNKDKEVIDLLVQLHPYFENQHSKAVLPVRRLISMLKRYGYEERAYVNEAFVENSKEIYAKWLIGQAIYSLSNGGVIPPVFISHANGYKERF